MARTDRLDPDNNLWHKLAHDLRIWRQVRKESLAEAARHIERTAATVSNYEAASQNIPLKHAETFDRVWATGGHLAWLRRLAENTHDPNWFDKYTEYEANAGAVSAYSALVLHGLLQTEDYARALIEGAQMAPDVELVLSQRMARQKILGRSKPPELWCLIKESVLRDPIGGAEVMRAQLGHLLALSERRLVVLQVVPTEVGAHAGVDGSFTLLTTDQREYAWSEALGGGRLLGDPSEVRKHRVRYGLIGSDALSRGSTRSLIASVMEAMQ